MKSLLTLALLMAMASCSPKNSDSKLKIARMAFTEDVKYGDPVQANDQISQEMNGYIFEGLMGYVYEGGENEIAPLVAIAPPKISKDNKVYTFTLRDDVFFHNSEAFPEGKGRKVKSEDFIYTFKRVADPRTGSTNWWSLDGMIEGLNEWREAIEKAPANERDALFEKPVKGFEAPDAKTLVIKLTKPYPQLNYILCMPHMAAMAKEAVNKYGPEIISHPVGSGPFYLKEWIRGSKIILAKNTGYRPIEWKGQRIPFLDEIHWEIIKEEQPRWLKFLKGDLDQSGIPKDNFLEAISADGGLSPELKEKGIELQKTLSLTSWWLEFNLKDPILGKNLMLRQALASAFDRARALQLLFNNRGLLADSPLPPTLEGADNPPPYPYAYNLERAQALLKEAGYPEGKGLPEFTFDLRGPSTTNRQFGEFVRDNFAKIGVRLNIVANSFPEALEKAKHARYQIMLGGWAGDYPDPENFLQLFYSKNLAPGTNSSNFVNPRYDALYVKIRTMLPSPERAKIVREMIEILQKEAAVAFFYHQVEYHLVQARLLNYRPKLMPMGPGRYWDLKAP